MDNTVIPAVVKAGLRAEISALTRASLEAQKKAAAGNKDKAAGEAVAAAAAAQASGAKFIALQVDVSCFQSDGVRKQTETRFKIAVGPSPSACQAAQASGIETDAFNWTCAAHSRAPFAVPRAKWREGAKYVMERGWPWRQLARFRQKAPLLMLYLTSPFSSFSNHLPISPFDSSDSVVV